MRVVLTGGHLSPLLAVVEALPKDFEALVVGRKHTLEGDPGFSLEYQTLQKKGIPFKEITTGRLQRRFTRHAIFSLFKFPYGFIQSLLILRKFRPDAVLSFGGYVSLPVTLASFLLRIPVVIHEQTLEAGLANKIASLFAKKVCLSWESSKKFFPKEKTVLTGNPIRKFPISNFPQPRQAKRGGQFPISEEKMPLIYITGGSSGSHAINVLAQGCLEKLLTKYKIFHQTGGAKEFKDFERLGKLKASLPQNFSKRYDLTTFIEPSEVGSLLYQADLVVSRAGMNTITEILFFGKPALLIPLPFSQNHEQIKNAIFLKEVGLGEVLDQEKITSDGFYNQITSMIKNLPKYKKSAESAKKLIRKEAQDEIIAVLRSVI